MKRRACGRPRRSRAGLVLLAPYFQYSGVIAASCLHPLVKAGAFLLSCSFMLDSAMREKRRRSKGEQFGLFRHWSRRASRASISLGRAKPRRRGNCSTLFCVFAEDPAQYLDVTAAPLSTTHKCAINIVRRTPKFRVSAMNKRVALVGGGALIAISVVLLAFGAPASDTLRDLKIIITIVFVSLGTALQIYATWPRRRHRYFTDDVWTGQREEVVQPKEVLEPKAKPKVKPKSAASNRQGRQAPSTPSIPRADHNDLTAN